MIGVVLLKGVKILMYTDDIIIHVTARGLEEAKKILTRAFEGISFLLVSMGLEVSLEKTQL